MKVLMAILFFLVILVITAGADTVSNKYYQELQDVRKQRDQLLTLVTEQEDQRDSAVVQRDEAQSWVASLESDVTRLQGEISLAQQESAGKSEEIAHLANVLAEKQALLDTANATLAAQTAQVGEKDALITEMKDALVQKDGEILALKAAVAGIQTQENGLLPVSGQFSWERFASTFIFFALALFVLSGGAAIARRRDRSIS